MKTHIIMTKAGQVSFRRLGQGARKILFFHGFPGSSAQIEMFDSEIQRQDLEVLCFDRPGYHQTEIRTQDMMGCTLQIAQELMEQQNWKQYEIVTVSGGTPFGLSFAMKNPDAIQKIRVICGLGDLHASQVRKNFSRVALFALGILSRIPGRWIQKAVGPSQKASTSPPKKSTVMDFFLPTSKPDLEVLKDPQITASLGRGLAEALQFNALGPQQDSKVFLSHWAKEAQALRIPLHFWHGDQDFVISPKVSEEMAKLFPHSKLSLVANEGHFSLPIRQIQQILSFDF